MSLDFPEEVSQSRKLEKLLQVLILGQLIGLPTLNSILFKFGIRSNYHQINCVKLYNSLTDTKIRQIFEYVFEQQFISVLEDMSKKGSSCWSKKSVTAVIDDSVFRQWLEQSTDEYYGRYFSGQFRTTVYGYKVVTLGVEMAGVLYPVYFDFVRNDKTEKAVEVAKKLIKRWGALVEKLKNQGVELPIIHLSCDNGYREICLSQSCEDNHLSYISVPKKSHLIEFSGQKTKLSNWLSDHYLKLEQAHQETQKELPVQERTPFTYRFRAHYCSQNREVTFLAFRLNGSKKVSIIYSTYFYRLLLRFYPPSSPWLMAGPPVRFFPDFYRSGDPVDVWIKTGYRIKSRGGFYPCGPLKCPYPAQQLESKLTNFLVLLHHTNLKAVPLIFRRLHKSLIPPIV